jgi:hypothetical protein
MSTTTTNHETTLPPPLPDVIYIIRHGEKPMAKGSTPTDANGKPCALPLHPDTMPPTYGVDCKGDQGDKTKHSPYSTSLTPRGWQRAGALAVLFAASPGGSARFAQPTSILATEYVPNGSKTESATTDTDSHRPYETVQPLSERLGLPIETPYPLGSEAEAMQDLVWQRQGVVLICWEHHHIYNHQDQSGLVAALVPFVDNPDDIFHTWDDCCFDAVWSFTKTAAGTYHFERLSQHALAGDQTWSPVRTPKT